MATIMATTITPISGRCHRVVSGTAPPKGRGFNPKMFKPWKLRPQLEFQLGPWNFDRTSLHWIRGAMFLFFFYFFFWFGSCSLSFLNGFHRFFDNLQGLSFIFQWFSFMFPWFSFIFHCFPYFLNVFLRIYQWFPFHVPLCSMIYMFSVNCAQAAAAWRNP